MAIRNKTSFRIARSSLAWTRTGARVGVRGALGMALPTLMAGACFLCGPAASAQTGGYMRVMTPRGQMAGESTDPKYNGWIPLRHVKLPSAVEIAAVAEEKSAGSSAAANKVVHPPVVIVKDRDRSSLALLGAFASHQHFTEIDIALTKMGDQPAGRYKLIDASVISIRASGTGDGTQEPLEQLRLNYAKIEVVE